MSRESGDCKVYVGDLAKDASEKDVERAFSYYGALKSVWVARNPPGFAFVEFEDPRDAEDAVRGLDNKSICGSRVRVEFSTGKSKSKPWQRRGAPSAPARRAFDPEDRCYECGQRGHYAYDCRYRREKERMRSRSPRRAYRSRSRSDSRDRKGRRRSRSSTRSPPPKRSRTRTRSKSRNRSRSRTRSSRSSSESGK